LLYIWQTKEGLGAIMTQISYVNGVIVFTNGHHKIIISNLKEFSDLIEKIKKFNYDDSETEFNRRTQIIDLLNSARNDFIKQRERECIREFLLTL